MTLIIANVYLAAALLLPMADDPNVKPTFDAPGMKYVLALLGMLMGFAILALIGIFIFCAIQVGASFLGRREGGAGKAVVGMIVTAIMAAIIGTGTVVFFQWVGYFK